MATKDLLLNRRQVLLGAVLGVQGLIIHLDSRLRKLNRAFAGFRQLSQSDFAQLQLGYTETPIAVTSRHQLEPGRWQYIFDLDQEALVCLSASADSAPTTFVHPLIVTLENGRRQLLPLLRSDVSGRRPLAGIILGRFPAGQHSFQLSQDDAVSLSIPDSLDLRLTKPDPDSFFATILEHGPTVKVRNEDNVLDDIPLVGYSVLSRHRRTGRYLVTWYLIFSSENSGTMPVSLYNQYGRTYDVEWVTQTIFNSDGRPSGHLTLYQREQHGIRQFVGGEMIDEASPLLQVATNNNNFSDGRIHLGSFSLPNLANPLVDGLLYRPKSLVFSSFSAAQHFVDQTPEYQQWSLFELAKEQCVRLNSGQHDSSVVADFITNLSWIQQQLTVEYPMRGCGNKLLDLD